MMRLFLFAALVAFAVADVSHLFNKGKKPFNRLPVAPKSNLQPARRLPVAPVQPARRLPVAPLSTKPQQDASILRSEGHIDPDGSYHYAYETANGIAAEEQGQQKQIGADSANNVQGSFQYNSPEGIPVLVQYVADENGYQPQSDLLPTPPPVPEYILRALKWIADHPQKEVKQGLKRF